MIFLFNRLGKWLSSNHFSKGSSEHKEWPVLATTRDRNTAYMIKALLNDANIEAFVEEDRTLGVLYGVQNILDYPIRVPEHKRREARGFLKESSFSSNLTAEGDD